MHGRDQVPRTALLAARAPERLRCERELIARGVSLPLMHRIEWMDARPGTESRFIAVYDERGTCRYGAGVQFARSRALPGHILMRVERLDPSVDGAGCRTFLQTLAERAYRGWPRVLRVYVELYSATPSARAEAATWLAGLGFRRADHSRMYRRTALVSLGGDEDAVFTRLHRSARRNVRVAQKAGLEVRRIVNPALAPRVDALIRESFARTGGKYDSEDWASIIELSAREPNLSRVTGMFRTDIDDPNALLAFEWACMNGDHALSIAAGSTKESPVRAPLAYALVWDIIKWARACGASYVDLGGVTAGGAAGTDPLAGVSEFKQSFGGTIVEVGEEWILEPHPVAAHVSTALGRAASTVARLRAKWTGGRRSGTR